jgi:hypothetical protein
VCFGGDVLGGVCVGGLVAVFWVVVKTIRCVVVVVAAFVVTEVVCDVAFAVVVPVGISTTGFSPVGSPGVCCCGAAGPCWAGGGADALVVETVARVASTVASTTPEPARMTIALDFERPSVGGAVSSGPVGSVTALSLSDAVSNGEQSALPRCGSLTACQ